MIRNLYKLAKKEIKDKSEIVHGRSDIGSLIGLRLKRKYGVKLIFDMRGFWADERIDGEIWSKTNILHRLMYRKFKTWEKSLMHKSDHIVSLTHEGQNEIIDKFRLPNTKVTVIPCCVNRSIFNSENFGDTNYKQLREEMDISNSSLVLTYLGSLGTWYLLEEMLDFFQKLKNQRPDAIMLFISKEPRWKIEEMAQTKGVAIESLRFVSAHRRKVPNYLSISNLGIFFIKKCYSKKASSPTKMGENLSMGIPVICNDGCGDVENIVTKYGCGYVMKELNENSYDQCLGQLDKIISTDKNLLLCAADEYFDLNKGVAKYDAIYTKLNQS